MKRGVFTVLLAVAALTAGGAGAQSSGAARSWAVAAIPEELKRDADAVVRLDRTEVEYVSPTLSRERHVTVVTILKGDAERLAYFDSYSDKFRSFSSFAGEIYDANGNLVRKIKNAELQFSDYSISGFADDNRTHFCHPNVPHPPFTIKYEWEITTKNAVWVFPSFAPQPTKSTGVERAEYSLSLPHGVKFRHKAYNFDPKYSSVAEKNGETHRWSVENIAPTPREPFVKPGWESRQAMYLSLEDFIYDGVEGSMNDWQSYARWQWKLLDRSSSVSPEMKADVARITAGATDDLEKIRRLYKFLGETTRYVSIQIGIGGFQPMSTEQVRRTGYGDCKALSNYMRLMLAECGIESHYVEIGMGRRSIPNDFASPYMSNHAILMVPMAADTLWVECTNPKLPLGYRHDAIVGQNALVYSNGSASVINVPRYDDSLNLSSRRAHVTLYADGSAVAHVSTTRKTHRFEGTASFANHDTKDRLNSLRQEVNIPVAMISNPTYREDKSATPHSVIEYDLKTTSLGARTGGRLFIPVMKFRKPLSQRFGRGERTGEIATYGYSDHDTTEIELPKDTLTVEAIPPPVALESKYGSYAMVCTQTEKGIKIDRRFTLRTGVWSRDEFAKFKAFIEAVTKGDNGRVVIVAKNSGERAIN
jgi:hypothetical protein